MVQPRVIAELESAIAQEPVDEVFISLPRDRYSGLIDTIVRLCEEQGIIVRVQTEMFNLKIARWSVDELDGMPIVTIRSGPRRTGGNSPPRGYWISAEVLCSCLPWSLSW